VTPLQLALNADTTPLSISDVLVFKSVKERAREARDAGFPAVNVDEEEGMTVEDARRILEGYQLKVSSGFFHGAFYEPQEEGRIFDEALRKAEFARALGQDCIFVSALVAPPERHAIAGRVQSGEQVSLNEQQFDQMAKLLERIARLWKEYGINLYYHPHVATYVEAPYEIESLMQRTDPDLVRLGPDTGHTFFGGGDPVGFIQRHFSRVGGLHLKDVRSEVVDEVRRERLNYRQACARGVWTELGTGDVDFPALFRLLRERDWSGWVIVETDHTRFPTALESSKVSRRYLKEVIGL
jgi:inosose dehydratase